MNKEKTMKKFLKFSPIMCLLIAFVFILSACSLGTYTVTFIDYDGRVVGEKVYSTGEAVTNSNSPRTNSRIAYSFLRWDIDGDPYTTGETRGGHGSTFNMYAIYQINTHDSTFNQSGCSIYWYGGDGSSIVNVYQGQTTYILIRDLNTSKDLTNISVVPYDSYATFDAELKDNYTQTISMNGGTYGKWNPSLAGIPASSNGEYNFVIELSASQSGEVQITCN